MILIYDGQCRLCSACLIWLQRKCEVSAHAFQDTDVTNYGLTSEQCSKEVFVIDQGATYAGALALAFLLDRRGNRRIAQIIRGSGILGKRGYRWVTEHRNSRVVKLFTILLEKTNTFR